MENTQQQIEVAFCLTDPKGDYVQHTAAAIASIWENSPSTVNIHIIHDSTLTGCGKEGLETLAKKYRQRIYYYFVDKNVFEQNADQISKSGLMVSLGTLYRLKIPHILAHLTKVIYLDSDVIVNGNLAQLWMVSIENYYCAAVLDSKSTRKNWRNRWAFRNMNISADYYFNAGVLYLNLEKIRHDFSLWRETISFLIKYGKQTVFFDQDALNYLLQKKTLFLGQNFNFIPVALSSSDRCKEQEAIIHFAGPKPWKYRCSSYDWLYWKYFSLTPWGNTSDKLVKAQKALGIDLGYALQIGVVASRKNLLKGLQMRFNKF